MKLFIALCACVLVVQPGTCSEAEVLLEKIPVPKTCTFTVMKKGKEGNDDAEGTPQGLGHSALAAGEAAVAAAEKRGDIVETPEQSIFCRPAKFGDQYTQANPHARPNKISMAQSRTLTMGNSEDACDEKVCDGGVCDSKVVLVFRGGCGFYDKAKNVWASSKGQAAAIMVADTQNTNANGLPITMSRGNKGDTKHDYERFLGTPVTAILKEAGEQLRALLEEDKGVLIAMHFGNWLDRENEWRLKTEIKDGTSNTSTTWHNLAISMMKQGKENEALKAIDYSATLDPTAELFEMQAEIYNNMVYVFKGARALCRAALLQRKEEKAQGVRPKKSLEYRKKAKEMFAETFEGQTLAHSDGDVHICDLKYLYNATRAADCFKGQRFSKAMYPKDPTLWSEEDRVAASNSPKP